MKHNDAGGTIKIFRLITNRLNNDLARDDILLSLRVIPNGTKKRFGLNQVTDIVRHILFSYRLSLNFRPNEPHREKFIEFPIENLFDIELGEGNEIALRSTFKLLDGIVLF